MKAYYGNADLGPAYCKMRQRLEFKKLAENFEMIGLAPAGRIRTVSFDVLLYDYQHLRGGRSGTEPKATEHNCGEDGAPGEAEER